MAWLAIQRIPGNLWLEGTPRVLTRCKLKQFHKFIPIAFSQQFGILASYTCGKHQVNFISVIRISSYVIARHDFTKCRCSEGNSSFCFKMQKVHFFLSKTGVPLSCQRYGLNWVSEHFFSRRQNLRVKLPVGSSPVTPLRCCVGEK